MTRATTPSLGLTSSPNLPHARRGPWRAVGIVLAAAGVAALARMGAAQAPATQPTVLPANRSFLPLADPVLRAAVGLKANRASAWKDNGSRMLLLEGDVSFELGSYSFRADRAVVRLDDEIRSGLLVQHLALYLDNARPLRGGPVAAQAPRLLVTASTTGAVELTTPLWRDQSAAGDPLVREAHDRINRYLARVSVATLSVPTGPVFGPDTLARRMARRDELAEQQAARAARLAPDLVAPAPSAWTQPAPQEVALGPAPAGTQPADDRARILAPRGLVSFNAEKIVLEQGANDQTSLALVGKVRAMYQDPDGKRTMTLQAENAVIFLAGKLGQLAERKLEAGAIQGIYLEENVIISDGQYTVRAPRVFYDLAQNKAVLLDAVLFTWDPKHNVPLYVRAAELKQESRTSWSASRALLTTSEFAEPHFSIAANKLTVAQSAVESGPVAGAGPGVPRVDLATMRFAAEDVSFRVGDTPLFYWPHLAGDAQQIPLQSFAATWNSRYGPTLRSNWDLFSLLGREQPEGVTGTGRLDYLGERGPALGADLDYERPARFGELRSYLVPHDQGEDRIGGRDRVEHDGDLRGFLNWRHREYLDEHWQLSLELAYVNDPTFLEQFAQSQADTSKPYETSAFLKRQEDDSALTLLAQYDLIDFTAQTTVLQAPGYTVDKQPELGYYRVGTSLWGDRLTYYTETRASRMRIRTGDETPADRGFKALQSFILFGRPRDVGFEEAADAAGLPDDAVLRFDTRHEIQAPMKLSFLDVTPYLAGRVTAYDDDFKPFDGGHGADDPYRLWGSAGVRLHSQFSRAFDSIESPILDLHRLRHIVEPSADLFLTGSSLDPERFPVFDDDVEAIQEGYGVRLGVRNTLQTQRGGPGRWRNVDWVVLDTELTFRGGDADNDEPIQRGFSYRPEYGRGGDHFYTHLLWAVTDTFAAVGELTQDLQDGNTSQWRLGALMRHTPRLRSFVDYSEIDPLSSRLLSYGFGYELTRKYTLGFRHTLDLGGHNSRSLDVTLERKLARWRLLVVASFDELDNEQSIGVLLIPEGFRSSKFVSPLLGQPLPE